jgi:hemolysin III
MKRTKKKISLHYSRGEEVANSLTHGAGAVLSVLGMVYLLVRAAHDGDIWHMVSFAIYGVSLFLLYLASTLYHSIPVLKYKNVLKRLDHSAIFLLIAGTYTPFLLNNLRGPWGWSLFGVIWGLTIIGLIIKLGFIDKLEKTSLVLYVAMGWLAVVAVRELVSQVGTTSLVLLLIGGLCYTVGVIFYLWRKLPYNHAIWHLFVLGGSITHYFSVIKLL